MRHAMNDFFRLFSNVGRKMKKQMIPLLAFAAATLSVNAAEYEAQKQTMKKQQQHCPEITPPTAPVVQNGVDVFVDAEFLYWYGKETNLVYAVNELVVAPNPINPAQQQFSFTKANSMDSSWDPGFRVGLGINLPHDGWDLYAVWTWFHNENTDTTSIPDFDLATAIGTTGARILDFPFGRPGNTIGVTTLGGSRASARWDLHMNQIDLQLGRGYWLSDHFSLRPYAGLRGAWEETDFTVKMRTRSGDVTTNMRTHFDRDWWGVGLLGGIQPTWYIIKNFGIYADLAIALLWGEFDITRTQTTVSADPVTTLTTFDLKERFKDDFNQFQTVIDLALGLRWQMYFSDDEYRLRFDLGWENHVWLDHNQLTKFNNGLVALDYEGRLYGQLSMTGVVFRARFDF